MNILDEARTVVEGLIIAEVARCVGRNDLLDVRINGLAPTVTVAGSYRYLPQVDREIAAVETTNGTAIAVAPTSLASGRKGLFEITLANRAVVASVR